MLQGIHKALCKGEGIHTPVKECVNIAAFVAPGKQAIQLPEVNITVVIPAKAFIQIVVPGYCIELPITKIQGWNCLLLICR